MCLCMVINCQTIILHSSTKKNIQKNAVVLIQHAFPATPKITHRLTYSIRMHLAVLYIVRLHAQNTCTAATEGQAGVAKA